MDEEIKVEGEETIAPEVVVEETEAPVEETETPEVKEEVVA